MSRRPSRREQKRRGFWGGVWLFLLGMTTGLGVATAIVAQVNNVPLPFLSQSPTAQRLPPAKNEPEEEEFEFRNLLRQQRPAATLATEEQLQEQEQAAARRFVYFLQVGAFSGAEAAEELRAQLALAGKNVEVRDGQTTAGQPLFRVWVGPFESEKAAEDIRAQLALEGFANASLLKTAQ